MSHMTRARMAQGSLLIGVLTGLAGCAAPMLGAVSSGDQAKVQALLAKGIDVNAPVYHGGGPQYPQPTPLLIAAGEGETEMIQLLIGKGAHVDIGNRDGRTPLMEAAFYGHHEAIKVLLAAGADPLAVNKNRGTASMLAKQGERAAVEGSIYSRPLDYPKIVQLLEEAERKARQRSGKQAEQAVVQATLAAKLPALQAAEQQGDEARQTGRLDDALTAYAAALRDAPPGTEPQQRVREKVIRAALALDAPPAIPDAARHHANRGMAFVKQAASREDYDLAVAEFEQALLLAPWWGDAYFNLGLVQEKAEEYAAAIQSFRLYLLAAPGDPNAGAVNKKLAELEVAQELAER